MEELIKAGVELGVAGAVLSGQVACGDKYVYEMFAGGILLALVDGIGHGPEAAAAAEAACSVLKKHASDPVTALAERCHDSLRDTRGVVMSLAAFDLEHNLLCWLGIGNVLGILWRSGLPIDASGELLLLRAGVVGSHLPRLRPSVLRVVPGDTLVLATDGVESGFAAKITSIEAPLRVAQAILDGYNKKTDDALVLVARYQGHLTNANREISN